MRTPILMYHHVERQPLEPRPRHPGSYVSRAEFARQLDALSSRRVATVSLAEAVRLAARGRERNNTVVLSFDDGCACFAETAWPELEQRGMTATLFVVSDRLGKINDWDGGTGERRERLLGAAELADLAAAGVEIGSHTKSHVDLTACRPDTVEREVAGSRADLQRVLGELPETFCYPWGRFDGVSRQAVERAGYSAAVSVWGLPGVSENDPFALPRVGIGPGESSFSYRVKSGGWYRRWRRLPRLGILRAAGGAA